MLVNQISTMLNELGEAMVGLNVTFADDTFPYQDLFPLSALRHRSRDRFEKNVYLGRY